MRIKHNDALHTAALHTADELGIKPSRIAAAIRAEQAERLLREDEQAERPSTRKVKAGKQGLPGRTRVERAVAVEEVESLATYGSWGYVGPRGMVSNVRDDLTVGVVEGSGADYEVDLPKYEYDPSTGRATKRVNRAVVLARYWRRFGYRGVRVEVIRIEDAVRVKGYNVHHSAVDFTVRVAGDLRKEIELIRRRVR